MFLGHQQSKQTDSTAAGLGEVPRSSRWQTHPDPLQHYSGVITGILYSIIIIIFSKV